MAFYTLQAINKAVYLGNLEARGFETVSGQMANDGLENLNEILGDMAIDKVMIPYYEQHDFTAVIGQEKYFIENLVDVDLFVFYIDSVRYSTEPLNRIRYFGTPRANNIQSLPFEWHFERELGGGAMYIYFPTDQNYPLQIWGKFSLTSVTINQDLSTIRDQFYINFLVYALADRMCQFYGEATPPNVATKLAWYYQKIGARSGPFDLGLQKTSTLQRRAGTNYGDVNIGHGYRPA